MTGQAAAPRPAVSGTTLRFAALVAAVLGTGAYAFATLYALVPEHAAAIGATYVRCVEAYGHALPAPDADFDTYVAANDRARLEVARCLAPVQLPRAAWVLAGLGILLAVSAALYLATPWWIRRRGQLVEVTADAFPRLHAELGRLCAVAGLDRPPAFLLDPTAGAPGGLAFGRTGRYAVRINAGLVPLTVTDPGLFRAVVLHELAHVRNRDVDLAYAVVALWRAFVVVALVPLVVLSVYPTVLTDPGRAPWDNHAGHVLDEYLPWDFAGYWATTVHGSVRALLLVAVVYLARNAVLRARETYADSRAADFGAGADLRRAVTAAAARPPAPGWRRWLGRFGVHPSAATRLATIDDPHRVHRPGFGELLGAGLTTAIAFDGLSQYTRLALPHAGATGGPAAAWLVAPVVTGILGAVAWRAWQSPGSPADRTRLLVTATLGFSLGWLVGDVASLATVASDWGVLGNASIGGQVAFGSGPVMDGYDAGSALVAALLLTGGMLAQAGVLLAAARSWSARGATGRWAWAAGVAVTAVPFAVWIAIWFDTHAAPHLVGHLYSVGAADLARVGVDIWQGPGFALLTLFYPPVEIFRDRLLAVPVLALAWLYPLAAGLRPWWRRPRPPSGPPPGVDTARPGPGRLREVPAPHDPRLGEGVRTALRLALVGAAGFAVALLAARAAVRLFAPERAGAADFPGYFNYCQLAAATFVQAVVGGVLAARRRPLGLVLGQLGAMVVAVLATVAVLGAQTLGGCVAAFRLTSSTCRLPDDLPWALWLLRTLAVEGALAALLAGVTVVLASALARSLAARAGVDGWAARRAWPAALLVLLLGAGGLAARGTYASEESTTVATARPSATAEADPRPARPERPLTAAEVTAAVEAAERGLPPGWRRAAEEKDSSAENRYDPAGCRSLATGAYRGVLGSGKQASAAAKLTNGGRLASTTVYVDVTSYATPVPESVLRDAERARVACPRYTITTATGFQVAYESHSGAAPPLGDQAWRVDHDLSTTSSPTVRGRTSEAVVRVGHTLVTVSVTAVGEPLDEALLLDLLTRTVSALPR
ncbi:hypothetical protein E1193_16135 [Micromonospora sp. KC606]|uniref:M48 family metalloprotease n=1 Tax=Micromonospora sp. KC606 TaxID=2530379 RepID=UPI001051A2A9|nr:M48 family metalloprotease [Micromonospora sp. KC606]TDC80992.1 hypothetical protein E1193_16135 [Micromonospora sp. KC606]